MRKITIIYMLCLFVKSIHNVDIYDIEWYGSWAQNCTFEGDDDSSLRSVESNGEECGEMCDVDPRCTHYTWTEGICMLKKGPIAKKDAIRGNGTCGLSNFDLKWKLCGYESDTNIDSFKHVYSICDLDGIKWMDGDYAYSCDFPESVSISKRFNTSSSECAVICDLDPLCTHYTWNSFDNGTCSLKKGLFSKNSALYTHNLFMICGFTKDQYKLDHCYNENKSESRKCSHMGVKWLAGEEFAFGCDFPGNDLSQIVNISINECENRCDFERECTHYTWTNNGTCYLKKGIVSKYLAIYTQDLNMICGITKNYIKRERCYVDNIISNISSNICDLATINWNGFYAQNCDFIGNDIDSIESKSPNECSKSCNMNPKCTHYTWNNDVCKLKKGPIAKSNAIPLSFSTNSVCGLTYFNDKWTWCGYNEAKGINNGVYSICDINQVKWIDNQYSFACTMPPANNDFLIVRNISESSKCFTMCNKLRNCTHFVWNADTCYFKSGIFSKRWAKFNPDNFYSICAFTAFKDKLDYCMIEDETKAKEAALKCDRILSSVDWKIGFGDWAHGCNFDRKNDILRLKSISALECSDKCKATAGCSHYVWSSSDGGLCTMKKGLVEKEDALVSADYRLTCGIVERDLLYENCVLDRFQTTNSNYNSRQFICNKLDVFVNLTSSRLPTCSVPIQDPCLAIYPYAIQTYFMYIPYLIRRLYRNYKIISVLSMSGLLTGTMFTIIAKLEEFFNYFTNRFSLSFTRIFTPF